METRSKVYEFEIRESATGGPGLVSGPALVYGDTATLANGVRETFAPGSLRRVEGEPIMVNVRHDQGRLLAGDPGSLQVEFRAEGVFVEFELPDTDEGREAGKLAKAGVLRGLSVEFRAVAQEYRAMTRRIDDALLLGVGMVPRPAYAMSRAEVRSGQVGRSGWVF